MSAVANRDPKADVFIPDELPAVPRGWTRSQQMHMNFGRDGAAAFYKVYDDAGRLMPIGYQYDTRKGGMTGFTVACSKDVMTWAQLVVAWPGILLELQK